MLTIIYENFYMTILLNEKTFALKSQILFPALLNKSIAFKKLIVNGKYMTWFTEYIKIN